MKTCRRCDILKNDEDFYKDKEKLDGLRSHCKACFRKYYIKNKERIKEYYRSNNEKIKKQSISYLNSRPWLKTYNWVKSRCTNPNHSNYIRYGERGIKLRMTRKEFHRRYIIDGASDMEKPRIHRRDNNGDYTFENTEYIEDTLHRELHAKKIKVI